MRTYYIAQGTLLSALWWPKWEGNPKRRGYMYTYSWFTSLYSRNQHNIVKQLYTNKKIKNYTLQFCNIKLLIKGKSFKKRKKKKKKKRKKREGRRKEEKGMDTEDKLLVAGVPGQGTGLLYISCYHPDHYLMSFEQNCSSLRKYNKIVLDTLANLSHLEGKACISPLFWNLLLRTVANCPPSFTCSST